jgi:hypothetical protein
MRLPVYRMRRSVVPSGVMQYFGREAMADFMIAHRTPPRDQRRCPTFLDSGDGLVVAPRRFPPPVAMMQPTQPRHRRPVRWDRRLRFHCPSVRRVFLQGIMDPVFLMIGRPLPDQPPKMFFAQRDDVVHKFAAAAPNPTLSDSILPGRMHTGPLRFQTRRLQNSACQAL